MRLRQCITMLTRSALAAPAGAIITTLPAACTSVHVGGAAYTQCGTTYYTRVSTGYQVVVLK